MGPEHQRPGRPHPAAHQDRDRGTGTDRGRRRRPGGARQGDGQPAGRRRPPRRQTPISGDRLMRVERRSVINADRDAVWKIVSDPDCYPSFMTSLERWETAGEQRNGAGARYTVHWKIGSVPVGGLIEVVEFDDRRDLAWVGITGVNLRGRIRLRDCGDGKTRVTFR